MIATSEHQLHDAATAARSAARAHAIRGDAHEVMRALRSALRDDENATRAYIASEVELDRFRTLEEFRALLRD